MKCIYCGHEQPSGRICNECGLAMERIAVSDPPRDTEVGVDTLTCRYCGHQQSGSRICGGCGMMFDHFRALPEEEEENSAICRECGLKSTRSRCMNCGSRIPGFGAEEE